MRHYKGFVYTPEPKTAWENLSMREKAAMINVAVSNGIIYKPKGKEGPTYIIHNIGGDVRVDPLANFTSLFPETWSITRIARPGTKDKPYTN